MTGAGAVINGRYRLRSAIASGATAEVYLADDLRLGREVAVKVLAPEQAREQKGIDRFHDEAQAAAALSHPNIVAVYDWGTTDETAFLVMQYVAGSDLRQILRQRGRLPEAVALRLAADLAAALQVAHDRGIVHRDVKPRNVLVDANGTALLADFGIAASANQVSDDNAVYGTALYVAPEQARGLAVDGRADLYSLGALLYEAVCGEPPFRGTTAEEVAQKHISAPLVSPRAVRPETSEATERLLVRALEKDPRRRFDSAAEMGKALVAAAAVARDTDSRATAREPQTEPARGERAGAERDTNSTATALEPAAVAARRERAAARPGAPVRRGQAGAWTGLPGARWAVVLAPLVVLAVVATIAWPSLATARQATVPDLAGRLVADAEAAVATAGLTLKTDEAPTADTPAGVIVRQDPSPNARPGSGSVVRATVSSGIEVPDLTGQQCSEARAALESRGWTVKPVRWRIANASDFGKVVAQDPQAGSVVKDKGQIAVQVAGPVRPC